MSVRMITNKAYQQPWI